MGVDGGGYERGERAAVAADRDQARVYAHLKAQQHRPAAEDVARQRDQDEREPDPDDRVYEYEDRGQDQEGRVARVGHAEVFPVVEYIMWQMKIRFVAVKQVIPSKEVLCRITGMAVSVSLCKIP